MNPASGAIVSGVEEAGIDIAFGRVLAENIVSRFPLPPFDRARMDGFAVRAADTFGAWETKPIRFRIVGSLRAGMTSKKTVSRGEAMRIATGAPVPRGASAVVMLEYCDKEYKKGHVMITRPVSAGENIQQAGSDVMPGEKILRAGTVLGMRETGLLSGLGIFRVKVLKSPIVGVLSTGEELVKPSKNARLSGGKIFDTNARAIMDGVRACGGIPRDYGIVPDNAGIIKKRLRKAISECDIVITSGGTSAGEGDLVAMVVDELGKPGVLVHGVNVKPGKPTILGLVGGKPVIGLPGFPTSALVIFEIFAAPLIRKMSGLDRVLENESVVCATLRSKLLSERGKHEFVPVQLIATMEGKSGFSAFPVGRDSGAITSLTRADGFIEVPESVEMIDAGSEVKVRRFSGKIQERPDYVFIGSHCIGMELIAELLEEKHGIRMRLIPAGSTGGLLALKRGEADFAGCHILSAKNPNEYNTEAIREMGLGHEVVLIHAYRREQGIMVKKGNPKGIKGIKDLKRVRIINRNAGSGTRIFFDNELHLAGISGKDIEGYDVEAKTHSAVATAVARGDADAGIGIRTSAEIAGDGFMHLDWEDYDMAVRKTNSGLIRALKEVLKSKEFRDRLEKECPGISTDNLSGEVKNS